MRSVSTQCHEGIAPIVILIFDFVVLSVIQLAHIDSYCQALLRNQVRSQSNVTHGHALYPPKKKYVSRPGNSSHFDPVLLLPRLRACWWEMWAATIVHYHRHLVDQCDSASQYYVDKRVSSWPVIATIMNVRHGEVRWGGGYRRPGRAASGDGSMHRNRGQCTSWVVRVGWWKS